MVEYAHSSEACPFPASVGEKSHTVHWALTPFSLLSLENVLSRPSKVQRAHALLDCPTLHRMGVDHCCSHVTVTQQFLNRSDVIIGLQQVAGETVAESV